MASLTRAFSLKNSFLLIPYCEMKAAINKCYIKRKKSLLLWKAINKHVRLILFLICLISVKPSTILTIEESAYNIENSYDINGLSIRIQNYTAKKLNITTVFDLSSKSAHKHLLQYIFPTSFIFYGDNNYANLLNRHEDLHRHFINKMPPNKTLTKANELKKNKKTYNNIDDSTSEEDDYLYDDYIADTLNKIKSKASDTSSCSACQQHQRAKKENLESIKKHILMRLQLSQPPNITVPLPAIPQKILDYFYKNFNYTRNIGHLPYERKSYKRKTEQSQITSTDDELRDEENTDKYLDDNNYDVNDEDDMALGDNTFLDNNFETSVQQIDEFYSRLHSIYVFPTKSRVHYNRKQEIFNFKFNSDPSRISSTILHVFIKGQDWIYEYQPDLRQNKNTDVSARRKQEIMVVIYRALRRPNSMNYTHTLKLIESRQKIPPGFGQWVAIEIKELSTYWMKTPNSTQSIVIRVMESWMRTFIVTEDQSDEKLTMHIEIVTKVNHRYKRNTALDCRESDNEVRCCRYPLKVNFTNFGWNFIVAPQHFDAYFCNGECNVGYLEKYTHTHITSLSTSAKPCCSPQKLSPLALLYFDNNNKLMYSTIPNMSVEKCSCS